MTYIDVFFLVEFESDIAKAINLLYDIFHNVINKPAPEIHFL